MRVSLCVNKVTSDREANREELFSLIRQSANAGADLVVFPEAVLTGLINIDEPSHDYGLGEEIPGPLTIEISNLVTDLGLWFAGGIIERDGTHLYDSAVLINPKGVLVHKYRRIDPCWHSAKADPLIYREGSDVSSVNTPFGKVAFLICGDLFNKVVVEQFANLRPDLLIYPFARCFSDDVDEQETWDRVEQATYQQQIKKIGSTTLMVNYVAEKELLGGGFGGAFVINTQGDVISSFPLRKTGFLLYDL